MDAAATVNMQSAPILHLCAPSNPLSPFNLSTPTCKHHFTADLLAGVWGEANGLIGTFGLRRAFQISKPQVGLSFAELSPRKDLDAQTVVDANTTHVAVLRWRQWATWD